jgi:hypothetical protein
MFVAAVCRRTAPLQIISPCSSSTYGYNKPTDGGGEMCARAFLSYSALLVGSRGSFTAFWQAHMDVQVPLHLVGLGAGAQYHV